MIIEFLFIWNFSDFSTQHGLKFVCNVKRTKNNRLLIRMVTQTNCSLKQCVWFCKHNKNSRLCTMFVFTHTRISIHKVCKTASVSLFIVLEWDAHKKMCHRNPSGDLLAHFASQCLSPDTYNKERERRKNTKATSTVVWLWCVCLCIGVQRQPVAHRRISHAYTNQVLWKCVNKSPLGFRWQNFVCTSHSNTMKSETDAGVRTIFFVYFVNTNFCARGTKRLQNCSAHQ